MTEELSASPVSTFTRSELLEARAKSDEIHMVMHQTNTSGDS